MRVRRVLALGITALFVAGACGGSTPAANASPTVAASVAPSATPTPIKIKSSYGNVTPANLAPFMAKELGLFEKRGLDVDLSLIDGGAPSAAALVSNQTQVGNFGGTEAMSGFVAGSDMQVVALFVAVTPWQFLAKADYKTSADLKGKTVGVASKGGSSEVAAVQQIERLGLKTSDVSILATGSVANLTAAMLANQVYAGPGHPPDTAALIKAGYKVIMDLAAQNVPAVENCTIVTTKYMNDHKDVMQKYVDSLIQAIVAMKKDKAGTIPVMQKLLNVSDQDALAQTYDYYVTQIFPVYPTVATKEWLYSRDELAKTNAAVKDLDVTKVFDNTFVKNAQDRKVGG